MESGSMNLSAPKAAPAQPQPKIFEGIKTFLIFVLLAAVGYLFYDNNQYHSQFEAKNQAELAKITGQIRGLENQNQVGEAKLSKEISDTLQAVGSTKAELKKTAQQIQLDSQKSRAELSRAISGKADTEQVSQVQAQVQAAKSDAETKISQVSTEVGGVRTDVSNVKTDLASTKRDLAGTQRQLIDVRETLSAAVAKNSSELGELRRKGERDYAEFEVPRRNQLIRIEDIQVVLTKTDPKKGKYSLQVVVDDNKLEKKDRAVNEPLTFLVGRNHLRYELVVNWVQKDRIGGYLSIPKDKTLAVEHVPAK